MEFIAPPAKPSLVTTASARNARAAARAAALPSPRAPSPRAEPQDMELEYPSASGSRASTEVSDFPTMAIATTPFDARFERVREALTSQTATPAPRNAVAFEALVEELRSCDDVNDLAELLQCFSQWSHIIATHHGRFTALLDLLFQFDWSMEAVVCDAFESLLASLVSANAAFLEPSLQLVIGGFLPPPVNSGLNTMTPEALDKRLEFMHRTLRRLLRANPLGCGALLAVLHEFFPRAHAPGMASHESFVRQALRVASYVPALTDSIVCLGIDRLLDIDVELASCSSSSAATVATPKSDKSETKKLKASKVNADAFDGDENFSVASADDMDADNDGDEVEEELSSTEKKRGELASKADHLMCQLFDFIDEQFAKSPSARENLFNTLLGSFERSILRTGRARSAQFLLFYAARSKSRYADSMVELLLQRITDRGDAPRVRLVAANFLGSFLARAQYLKSHSCKSALDHAVNYLGTVEDDAWSFSNSRRDLLNRPSSRASHSTSPTSATPLESDVYLAVFQAVAYALLYKGGFVGGNSFMESLPMWSTVLVRGRPLERINHDIAEEFRKTEFHNDEGGAVQNSDDDDDDNEDQVEAALRGEGLTSTHIFFPFDPLALPEAKKRIEPLYQHWFIASHEDAEEEEEEEDEPETTGDPEDTLGDLFLASVQQLNAQLPKPVRIARIRRLLGGDADDLEEELLYAAATSARKSFAAPPTLQSPSRKHDGDSEEERYPTSNIVQPPKSMLMTGLMMDFPGVSKKKAPSANVPIPKKNPKTVPTRPRGLSVDSYGKGAAGSW